MAIALALLITFFYYYLMPVLRDPSIILPRNNSGSQTLPTSRPIPTTRDSTWKPLLPLSLPQTPLIMPGYGINSDHLCSPPPVYASQPNTPSPEYASPRAQTLAPQTAYDTESDTHTLAQKRNSAPANANATPADSSDLGTARRYSAPSPQLRLSPSPCAVELQVQDVHVPSRALLCNNTGNGIGTSGLGLVPSIWKRSSLYPRAASDAPPKIGRSRSEGNPNVGEPF